VGHAQLWCVAGARWCGAGKRAGGWAARGSSGGAVRQEKAARRELTVPRLCLCLPAAVCVEAPARAGFPCVLARPVYA